MDISILNDLIPDSLNSIKYLKEVDSTNNYAKKLVLEDNDISLPLLVTTDDQTQGKGRMGRIWKSEPGQNIAMSILLKAPESLTGYSSVTLLSALAVVKAINDVTSLSCLIKWPNDVIFQSKKVCGILTEMISMGSANYIIVGIGINANSTSFPEEIKDKATSIKLASEKDVSREELITNTVRYFIDYYNKFVEIKDLSFIIDEYNSLLISKDKEVILSSDNIPFPDNPYISRGIDHNGGLIVESKDKKMITVTSGEVSVRGVLGYV
ncbi:MAG: biotin--[Eubacterium sp.]|nr:biotin--[acetyl-CoA-carboxylase] ligase [Eubacterium sp.]